MRHKEHFSRFLSADPERLHFAAHSHHPWPDVTFAAQQQAWEDAARWMDDKWGHFFGTVYPEVQRGVADNLGLADPQSIVIAPNTHQLLVRIFSCIEPPVRLLSTDSEFHSFARQSRRWEEEGLAIMDRIPVTPYETFAERFGRELRAGVHDLVFLSEVFYNSGFVVPGLHRLVASLSEEKTLVVIDGYHAYMARPTNIGPIQDRVFYLTGGYKYAMSGEGVCFLHAPPRYGPRPVDTGWFAAFGALESGMQDEVPYPKDGSRFAGATFDPSGVYRMRAVLSWMEEADLTPARISSHVRHLQQHFLAGEVFPGELIPPLPLERGNFLAFRTEEAQGVYEELHRLGVVTDYRGDRIRFGFGIYHDESDVDRLITMLRKVV